MLTELLQSNRDLALLSGGLLIGVVYGAVSFRSGFCVMGAVSDATLFGDLRRLRMVALAAAIALALTTILRMGGITDVTRSIYLSSSFDWLGAIAGGLIFGIGMVLSGGCISRCLVRTGAGDLRALITALVTGIAAYAAMGGIFGFARDALQSATRIDLRLFGFTNQGIPDVIATATSQAAGIVLTAVAAAASAALLYFAASGSGGRLTALQTIAALSIGALVAAAWALTGLAFDEMALKPAAVEALSFVRPTGDAIEWIARATALGFPNFGAAAVFGTIFGGTVAAAASGRLHICGFAGTDDLKRHLAGALLMGIGGVWAMGCSIGNGLSGVSTLSLSSILAAAAILTGARAGIRWLERSA